MGAERVSEIVIPERLLAQLQDAVSASRPSASKMRALVEEIAAYQRHGNVTVKPWAICQGGLIQDSSDGVETVDLDWMEHGYVADRDEAEDSWRLLTRIVNHEGRDAWGGDLHEVEEMLTTYYGDNGIPEEERVWA